METQALAKNIRISPRKIGLVSRMVRRFKPIDALLKLDTINQKGARLLKEIIKGALNNAKMHNMKDENIQFKSIEVSKGMVMKRFRAVSRGSAHSYKKKTSHVKVILTDEKLIHYGKKS